MKPARLGPRTWLGITVIVITGVIGIRLFSFIAVEREACLDSNGSWHTDSETCRFADEPAGR